VQSAVSGLDREFPGQVQARSVDATGQVSVREVQELGFRSHGLVIRSSKGEALWKQPDHEVDMAAVREALRSLLAGR
jgi:hypothetical protein